MPFAAAFFSRRQAAISFYDRQTTAIFWFGQGSVSFLFARSAAFAVREEKECFLSFARGGLCRFSECKEFDEVKSKARRLSRRALAL